MSTPDRSERPHDGPVPHPGRALAAGRWIGRRLHASCSPRSGHPTPTASGSPTTSPSTPSRWPSAAMRTGRLPSPQDADVFRLTVDTPDHLRITVTPPADGSINLRLESGSLRVGDIRGDPGTPIVHDVAAPAGRLRPVAPAGCAQPGQVLPDRRARGSVPAGRRPGARQRPRARHGRCRRRCTSMATAPTSGDEDWYALGSLPERRRPRGPDHGHRPAAAGLRRRHRLRGRRRRRGHATWSAGCRRVCRCGCTSTPSRPYTLDIDPGCDRPAGRGPRPRRHRT